MSSVVVSAYLKIPSKRSHQEYLQYLKRFFRSIKRTPVIFFTTADLHEELHALVGPDVHVRFILLNKNLHKSLKAFSKFGVDFWKRHLLLDLERGHSAELSAMWYEKTSFVLRAADEFPQFQHFIWCDAGCIRSEQEEKCLEELGARPFDADSRLHIQRYAAIKQKPFYGWPDIGIAGAIIYGTLDAWKQHEVLYDEMLKKYTRCGRCATGDQYVLLSCADQRPNQYVIHDPPSECKVDPWFFFLQTR